MKDNFDQATVEGFGKEWTQFDQTALTDAELSEMFDHYFRIFPWRDLPTYAEGFDLGCGSGRWARYVAPRVKRLHCVDASEMALAVAKQNLKELPNCEFHLAIVSSLPFEDNSMDFGASWIGKGRL